MTPPGGVAVRNRFGAQIQIGLDLLAWCVALYVALSVRYDFENGRQELRGLLQVVPLVLVAQFWFGILIGLYQRRWRFGSFEEVRALALSAGGVGVLVSILNVTFLDRPVPRSVPFGATAVALIGMLGTRYVWRSVTDRRLRPSGAGAERVVVVGAGEGGAQAITAILRNPDARYYPVALLDDDPSKRRLEILGVQVRGTTHELAAVARDHGAETVILAVPSASGELVRRMTELCERAGLVLLVLPQTRRLYGRVVGTSEIRRPTAADLLGRREIDTDLASIAGYLTGKRVLVTGAGGSIGSELCRQITGFGPAELVMVDRDESALHAVQLSIEGRALLDSPNLVVADIRDRVRVRDVFARWQPEVVFHAAALKHLPLLELHPDEGVKTNVFGTQHVLDAAVAHGVDRFVNISTDKAADPSSVLGATKRISERMTAEAGTRAPSAVYLSVRFGNVLGSRGSLLDSLVAQIDRGGPVTITHPEVTRYFMTIEEAVQLVVQAGGIGASGQALVLDMGAPVRILDLAHQLISLSGEPVETVFTGLRPGEKLHEVLLGTGEDDARPVHPLISHVPVAPLAPTALAALSAGSGTTLKLLLAELCQSDDIEVRP